MARVFVLLALLAVARGSAAPIVREALLDAPLAELLAHPIDGGVGLDASLQQALVNCRASGIVGVVEHQEDLSPLQDDVVDQSRQWRDDVAYCHRIRYVRHKRQRRREREAATKAIERQPETEGVERGDEQVLRVYTAEKFEYQTFFEAYAEKHFPTVLCTSAWETVEQREKLASVLTECFDPRQATAVLRIDHEDCKAQLNDFRVPPAIINNYIVRTNASLSQALLPTLLVVSTSPPSTRRQATCPFGLHTLIRPTDGSVEYALFDSLRIPYDQNVPDAPTHQEMFVNADASALNTLEDREQGEYSHITPSHREVLLSDQSLFIPGGSYAVTLAGKARVLRHCFVDASNFNHAVKILQIEALVSPVARKLYRSFRSAVFDTSMMRQPYSNDTVWPSYMQWPKETKLLKRRSMVSVEGISSTDRPMPMTRRERLKLWQDGKRWERHVHSLTLPVPLPPVVVNVTRSSVTLRWQDLYERPKNDITGYGYEVHWKREEPHRADGLAPEAAASHGAVNFTHKEFVRSTMPTSLFGEDFDGKDIEGVINGLAADTTYTFTIRMYVGDNAGVESERSRSAQTAACSSPGGVDGVVSVGESSGGCIDLRWLATRDDGGQPIKSYLFAIRYTDGPLAHLRGDDSTDCLASSEVLVDVKSPSTMHSRTPTWLSTSLCEQLPGRVQLRVAVVNSMGVSTWTRLSDPSEIKFQRSATVATVRARGDPSHLVSLESLLVDSGSPTTPSHFPRVVMSDVNQEVVVAPPGSRAEVRFDVWAGHHSPRGFHISSELVLADPADASYQLRNIDEIAGRVVVIARDDAPFVFKLQHAQRAGAVGVIFVNVDGRCRRDFDQRCVPGASKSRGEGFGFSDRHPLWRRVRIPFVIAMADASAMLLELFKMQ